MAKFTSVALFFLLASLVGCVFTLPLLQQNVIQLEDDLLLVSGDVSIIYGNLFGIHPHRATHPQSTSLPSQLALTNSDLQRCINDIHKIQSQSITSLDAALILKIIEDFQPKLSGVLGNLQGQKSFYKTIGLASAILKQVKAMQSSMASLMGSLVKALPAQFQGEAKGLKANMGAEFHTTVSIYSSK